MATYTKPQGKWLAIHLPMIWNPTQPPGPQTSCTTCRHVCRGAPDNEPHLGVEFDPLVRPGSFPLRFMFRSTAPALDLIRAAPQAAVKTASK